MRKGLEGSRGVIPLGEECSRQGGSLCKGPVPGGDRSREGRKWGRCRLRVTEEAAEGSRTD